MPFDLAIYLASPLGFVPYGATFSRHLVELVALHGARPLDPWSTPESTFLGSLIRENADLLEIADANRNVGAANRTMLDTCDGVLACLDGPSVDDGTASEIGYATGIGKTITGFRTDLRTIGDNRATSVNLQVASFIEMSGGAIFHTAEEALVHLLDHLRNKPEELL